MKLVSVITVNYNQPKVTEALLQSIFEHNAYANLEIIVVDNGSSQNPVPGWKQKYKDVQFIRSEENLGFAGGNNWGIEHAQGEYYFLINNDTEITNTLIGGLVQKLEENPLIGIISPKIRYYDQPDVLQYAGYTSMNYFTCQNKCIGQFEKDMGQYDHVTGETGYAHGAAMMIRRGAAEKAGLMSPLFFLYYEELDWCEKIKRAGYTIWVDMQQLIYHKESISVGKNSALKEYYMNRNRILFIRRNAPVVASLVFYPYFIIAVVPRNIIRYIKEKNFKFISVLFKAIWWNITSNRN
ncbi:glycosyltransferase family 2 protein [Chitinophagaceae bacterium LWZ2-11]